MSVTSTPLGRTSATSPSSRNTIRFVWARIAATSLAMKLSSPFRPTISGTSWRAPTSRLISPLCITTIAYAPSSWRSAARTASARSPLYDLFDEMGDRLGVGLRRQRVAARLESVAQLAEVLDDPVVDDRDVAGAVLVGVGVQVVRPAVGRPARVGEADRGVRRPVGDGRREVRQLAGLASRRTGRRPRRRGRSRPSRTRGTRAASALR